MRLIILLLTLSVLTSCEKSEAKEKGPCQNHGPAQTFFILDNGLVNCKFKPGTYWVFYDSITNSIDSNLVYNQSSSVGKADFQCDNFEYWSFDLQKYGPSPGNLERFTMNAFGIGINSTDPSLSPKLYFPPGGHDNSSTVTHQRIDSLFIYNKYYKNIMISTFPNDPVEPNHKAVYYFNTDFGYLRKDLYNSSNQLVKKRQLIRVNIVL